MFKKIEIWILYLVLILSVIFAVGFGFLVRQELVGSTAKGTLSRVALWLAETPVTVRRLFINDNALHMEEDRFPSMAGFQGEAHQDKSYLLLSRYDGDLKQGVVDLVDLQTFTTLHTWNPDLDAINAQLPSEGFDYLLRDSSDNRGTFKHPILSERGELIFHNDSPLRKIDACSNLLFQNIDGMYHHSIERDADGNLWVPRNIYPTPIPARLVGEESPFTTGYVDDGITQISPLGETIYVKSVSEIFIEHHLEERLFATGDVNFTRDPIHLNDIQPVKRDGPYWKKGDVFLSIKNQSMVLLYRPAENKVIWMGTGHWFQQHDVDILDDHRISVFNNNSKHTIDGNKVDGNNEIVIYDFETDQYSSYSSEALAREDVRTLTQGLNEILPDGKLWLQESNYGRMLMLRKNGTVKWSFVNRASDGRIYNIVWSRLLHSEADLNRVAGLLTLEKCDG